ncbi:MAG: FecR family protein [Dehalococcoidales bacterium]|nr:FecR family protein [Dehalococcoidales bacterium]
MRTTLHKAFDDCLKRIKTGETINACAEKYPYARRQLVPLLSTALSIMSVPRAEPSDNFRKLSKDRLLARLISLRARKSEATELPSPLLTLWKWIEQAFRGRARFALPAALVLVLAVQAFFIFGGFNFISRSPAPTLASQGTLNISAGRVQVQLPGSNAWEEATSGLTVSTGSRLKTGPDSQATVTLFNGTAITLDPNTDLALEKVAGGEKQPTVIVLKLWLGKTLSRVAKLADVGGHYEIQTPSAVALVRGTVFVTEVDGAGNTRVQTIEGLVSVSAQGREVFIPAGQQTTVQFGTSPSEPAPASQTGMATPGQGTGSGTGTSGNSQIGPSGAVVVTGDKPNSGGNTNIIGQPGSLPDNNKETPGRVGQAGWTDQYEGGVLIAIWMMAFLLAFAIIKWLRRS